jgi:hypothetical protein
MCRFRNLSDEREHRRIHSIGGQQRRGEFRNPGPGTTL